MPRKPKPKIGTCPCPMCGAESRVSRDAAQALYAVCPVHSRFNGTDYILEHGYIFGASEPAPVAAAPVPAPSGGVKPISIAAQQPVPERTQERVEAPPVSKNEQDDARGIFPWLGY